MEKQKEENVKDVKETLEKIESTLQKLREFHAQLQQHLKPPK